MEKKEAQKVKRKKKKSWQTFIQTVTTQGGDRADVGYI